MISHITRKGNKNFMIGDRELFYIADGSMSNMLINAMKDECHIVSQTILIEPK
jgi:hypothetical protein